MLSFGTCPFQKLVHGALLSVVSSAGFEPATNGDIPTR